MSDDSKFSGGPEVKAIFDLSAALRTTAFVLCVIVLFTWILLYMYRPAVSNDDLFGATFTSSITRKLVETSDAEIEKTFKENLESFDTPYDSIARAYIRERSPVLRANALQAFFNNKSQSQRQYVLLLVEEPRVRHLVNEYLEDDKSRWQTMPLPILGLQINRNEATFYLCIAFAAVHFYFVVKHRYVLEIRRRIQNLSFIPDPSLISATPTDLAVLGQLLRIIVYVGQEGLLIGLPILMCALVGLTSYRSFRDSNGDASSFIRPTEGFTVCAIEAVFVFAAQLSCWAHKRELWKTVFSMR